MTDEQVWALWLAVVALGMPGVWRSGAIVLSLLLLLAGERERRRLMREEGER